ERAITAFARSPNGGLILTGSALAVVHRDLIITLAAHHKLPAVYYRRLYVTDGGLISYGPDIVDQFRLAAGYVDRILKGEKPTRPRRGRRPPKHKWSTNPTPARRPKPKSPPTVLARADGVIK